MSGINQQLLRDIGEIINQSNAVVFLTDDFAYLGKTDDIDNVLGHLISKGRLLPIGEGLLAKGRKNAITGNTMLSAAGGFDEVAKAGLNRLGVWWKPGTAEAAYISGGNQIPVRTIVRVKPGVNPRIAWHKFELRVEW